MQSKKSFKWLFNIIDVQISFYIYLVNIFDEFLIDSFQAELEELGMDPQDIEDMFDLADMMKEFVSTFLTFLNYFSLN